MSKKQTPEEMKAVLKRFTERYNRVRSTLVENMETAMRDCLESQCATDGQKSDARSVLAYCATIRKHADCGEVPIPDAIYAGMAYERCNLRVLEGSSKSGSKLGTMWRGYWIELQPLHARIARYLSSRLVDGKANLDLQDLVTECWRPEHYNEENRGKYKTAMTGLSNALCEAKLPKPVAIRIRKDRVIVEEIAPQNTMPKS